MRPRGVQKLKDVINTSLLNHLSKEVKNNYQKFDGDSFIESASLRMYERSFFERINQAAESLYLYLPKDFQEACSILVNAAPPPVVDEGYGTENYYVLILTRYISLYGLEYLSVSLPALATLTRCYTAEFDIRPFIQKHQEKTFEFLRKIATSENFHERRLASEGCRPRLPLASHLNDLKDNPQPCIEIVSLLKTDPVKYVQKSVANNLGDILKDNPQIGYKVLFEWVTYNNPITNWIIKRAIRKPLQSKDSLALDLSKLLS